MGISVGQGTSKNNYVLRDVMYITNGGLANNTSVFSSGKVCVFSSGLANNTSVFSSGEMNVSRGGFANNTSIFSSGNVYVSKGGSANNTTIFSQGCMAVYSEGRAENTTVNAWSDLDVCSGGRAVNITLNGGDLDVYAGGRIENTTVNSGGFVEILWESVASHTAINFMGIMEVFSKGRAENTTINSGGAMYVYKEGFARSTTIDSGGVMGIYIGGRAENTTIDSGGVMGIKEEGVARHTAINSSGIMVIFSEGRAENTTINTGGSMYVNEDGGACNTTINSRGSMTVHSGGRAEDTTVCSKGKLFVSAGGAAFNTLISAGTVSAEDALLDGTCIGSDGYVQASSGVVVQNTTVNSDGLLEMLPYSELTGTLMLQEGAIVAISNHVKFDFDLTEKASANGYLINDLSILSGMPDYTITINQNHAPGVYKLARGADGFSAPVTIGTQNADYGTLTTGEVLAQSGYSYLLSDTDGDLKLTITPAGNGISADKNGMTILDGTTSSGRVAELSKDNFETVLTVNYQGTSLDTFGLAAGTYRWQEREALSAWQRSSEFVSDNTNTPQQYVSDEDEDPDLFFAKVNGTWSANYVAQHQGNLNGWTGTGEQVVLTGKNRIADTFAGSSDEGILFLTDDGNGDALFLDDIYTQFGNSARISKIDRIYAGAGDDVVDLSSQKFDHSVSTTVFGGAGNDTIWSCGHLYGDAGDDRLIGSEGEDWFIGGSGNDVMHGGGGVDYFFFGGNWGNDTVEQLAGGHIYLVFENGSQSNWNSETMTYTDGANSVKLTGVDQDKITISCQESFTDGVFEDHATEKICEERNRGVLA